MTIGLVGKKQGMTRVFTPEGDAIAVTVVSVEPNTITQIKSQDRDGYSSVQVTTGSKKEKHLKMSEMGHFKKNAINPGEGLWEFRITEEEAYYLAENDIDNLMDELDRNIPWWTELNNPRKRALLNMAYNVGTPTLMKFQKTLGLLESGQYEEASKEVLNSRWAKQVGRRADFISNVFLTGSEE